MIPNELFNGIKEIVAEKYPFHMGSEFCKAYTDKHPSCEGCESEKGCEKANKILGFIYKGIEIAKLSDNPEWKFNVSLGVAKKVDEVMDEEDKDEYIK